MKNPESVDISLVRNINSRAVLDSIFNSDITSRTILAKQLGMSKSSVSSNLAGLIERGIVLEIGEGKSAVVGGRKPQLLTFNKNHKYILAIDLNMTSPLFVLGNLRGEQLVEFSVHIEEGITQEAYLSMMENAVNLLLASRGMSPAELAYIAIAAPGVFDQSGRLCSQNPKYRGVKWKTLDLHAFVRERFGVDVLVKNDIKTAALGEWIGSAKKTDNMLYFSCGQGIGTGLILDGRLYEGSHFAAGEIYNYIDQAGFARGETIEDAICIKGLLARVQRDIAAGEKTALSRTGELGFGDVVDAYRQGDAYTLRVIDEIAGAVDIIIANIVNLLDIDCVVLGGEYQNFTPAIIRRFQRDFARICRRPPQMLDGVLRQYAGVQGIFYIARDAYFDSICQ